LAFVIAGLAISGWQSSPDFWEKTDFLVVVLGAPVLAVLLTIGWMLVKPGVVEVTSGRLKARWSNNGPTYPSTDTHAFDAINIKNMNHDAVARADET
jgi:L-asparagine permease